MAEISTLRKYKIILEEFEKKEDSLLTGYDEVLKDRLNLSPKQIDRLIEELSLEFDNIIRVKGSRKKTYKLLKPIDLFVEAFDKSDEIGWFFNMAQEADPDIFKELEQFTNDNKKLYKFQNSPFEDVSTLEEKDIFKKLKRAVKNREYVKIKYKYSSNTFDNLKCLKLLFIDNNWYLAFIDYKNNLRLSRVSFIENVDYASKVESFQLVTVEKQMNFLNNKLQNAMTLFGVIPKTARLKVHSHISRYFEKGMKKFLSTQNFIKKYDDGSIEITVEYTQNIEVLPFIQSWMPNMIILEPQELKDEYLKRLKETISNQNTSI